MSHLRSTNGCAPTGRTFESGAKRNNAEGKGRYDLIVPEALERLAKRLEQGANEHGEYNFMLGIPNSSLYDSALRHLNQAKAGCTDEDHLGALFTNVMFLIYNDQHDIGGLVPTDPEHAEVVIEEKNKEKKSNAVM